MARPLRIEYRDAWYHVMNRGRRGEAIFSDEKDYVLFVELLQETSEMWNVRIAAYCLMPNHYHMLVQTPDANISRSMRHLNGVYTQRYNSHHKCDGQLFRGRYKSILVDTDSYLLQVVRYIHRNPIEAGLVDKMDSYQWCSHQGYISIGKKWDWIYKNCILSMLSKNRKNWLRYYRKWVSVEEKGAVGEIIDRKKWPVCIGPQTFIDWVKERYGEEKISRDIPSSRELLPDMEKIVENICEVYRTTFQEIIKMRRGKGNEARNVAIYLSRKLRRDTLREVGKYFNIDNDSTVSSVMARVKERVEKDERFHLRLDKIIKSIQTS